LYTEKGSFFSKKWYDFSFKEGAKLKYIEIPLIFGRKIGKAYRDESMQLGLSYSKLIASQINYKDIHQRLNASELLDFKKYDFSFLIGLMVPIDDWSIENLNKIKHHHFFIDCRLSKSILSIHEAYKVYNFSLSAGIIYLI
jgi:hypothetical protein